MYFNSITRLSYGIGSVRRQIQIVIATHFIKKYDHIYQCYISWTRSAVFQNQPYFWKLETLGFSKMGQIFTFALPIARNKT